MKLGFIGTGNISSDVITGICNSKISFKKIIVSPRNKKKAQYLKKKFKKVSIAKSNQEVIEKVTESPNKLKHRAKSLLHFLRKHNIQLNDYGEIDYKALEENEDAENLMHVIKK